MVQAVEFRDAGMDIPRKSPTEVGVQHNEKQGENTSGGPGFPGLSLTLGIGVGWDRTACGGSHL